MYIKATLLILFSFSSLYSNTIANAVFTHAVRYYLPTQLSTFCASKVSQHSSYLSSIGFWFLALLQTRILVLRRTIDIAIGYLYGLAWKYILYDLSKEDRLTWKIMGVTFWLKVSCVILADESWLENCGQSCALVAP